MKHVIVILALYPDPPGCGCGFMSVERMRILLRLDSVGEVVEPEKRQQITPDMKFTCDGMITKWIIGGQWFEDGPFSPELQLWREIGNDTYQKINGINITNEPESDDGVYEYDNFPPIPFQAGDILGVFVPQNDQSKLNLKSEGGRGPTNYFINTSHNVTISPYDTIYLKEEAPQIQSEVYHPLITVEISKCTNFLSTSYIFVTTSGVTTATESTYKSVTNATYIVSHKHDLHSSSFYFSYSPPLLQPLMLPLLLLFPLLRLM